MKEFIQKHWINGLGLGLIFTGILYFLKLAIDNEWLPVELRIALSVALGFTGLYSGYRMHQKGRGLLSQVLAGMGVSILYATIGYLSFTDGVNWSNGALLVSMVGLSLGVSAISVREEMRVLFGISLLGGLITPFFIHAIHDMDTALFIYLLALNVSALYASYAKGWVETKVISFVLSMGIYGVYYHLFEPEQWGRPFFYVTFFFVVYTVGLLLSSIKKDKGFDGLDLYLGVVNSVHFVFWSVFIFKSFSIPHAIPLLIVGAVFLGIALMIFFRSDKTANVGMGAYAFLGLLVMAIAGNDMGMLFTDGGMNHVITAGVWTLILSAVFLIGRRFRQAALVSASAVGFVVLLIYWYSVAWEVEWIEMFGIKYIPFLNAGAFIWMSLVALGFALSRYTREHGLLEKSPLDNVTISTMLALVSHLLIGGLLSIQILNLWEAYDLSFVSEQLSLSVCWFIYALILFLHGSSSGERLFHLLGGFVLVFSTCKVFLFDLSGESSFQTVFFLLALGGLTLLIAKVKTKAKPAVIEQASNESSDSLSS